MMTEPTPQFGPTPSQTVGPYLSLVLPWPDGPDVVADGTAGAITITGRLTDGAGDPVPDGLIEIWQADPQGRFDHADDPRGALRYPAFGRSRGFGRCPTGPEGEFGFRTVKPGPLPDGSGGLEAPHLDVSVFARGLLDRVVTRLYFPDEGTANAADPLLARLPADQRARLIAHADAPGELRFDIRLQGEAETPFFRL